MIDESVSESIHWKDPINITQDQWMSLLKDEDVTTEKDIQLLTLIYNSDGFMATASQLARILNMPHFAPLNSQVGRWGKRIVKRLGIQAIKQKYGEGVNWWHVPFWGTRKKGGFYWILRPELREAIYELNATEEILFIDEVTFPEEIGVQNFEDLYEGARKQVFVNSYERNRRARDQCVQYFGARCIICSFDFEEVYGDIGRGIIHVHHLKPLSEIGESYRIDPLEDLRPVCPNCHLMIHKSDPPYSIDEVIKMIKKARANSTGEGL